MAPHTIMHCINDDTSFLRESRLGIRLKINRQKLKHFNFYVKVKILLTQL